MITYTYETYITDNGTPGVKIYRIDTETNKKELLIVQDINPETGQPFQNDNEVKAFIESVLDDMIKDAIESQKPKLTIRFLNPETNEPVDVVNVGDEVKVDVELYYGDDDNKIYAPVTGKYIVTYFYKDTDIPAGTTIIDIEEGKGSGIITFNKSGVFEIKLDKILNAQTMKQPEPLPELDTNPVLSVVEPLKSDNTETDNTSTTE